MITAHEAIARFRRDATLGAVIRASLVGGVIAILGLHFVPLGRKLDPSLLLLVLGGIWISLWYRTARGSRLAAESSSLIASGELDQAEQHIALSLRSFSLSRSVKSMGLLNLALLRLTQKRWGDAALLCREVLGRQRGMPPSVSRSALLILADALLELGDLRGAHQAISGLYVHRLPLPDALNLLRVQSDYLARIGAWSELFQGAATKVALAELMPSRSSARTQALLALAAKNTGVLDWSNWLRRRVELLADARELAQERPLLWELWQA